jgi:hypothetical protein
MKNATCSSTFMPVAAALESKIATRISSSGGSSATVRPQPKREMRRSSMPVISLGYVSQVITTCLCASISVLNR